MTPSESVILCEGYHDRAFWKGWLEFLGCREPPSKNSKTIRVFDPWNRSVQGGQFGYESSSGHFVRIIPCGGKPKIPERLENRLRERTTNALHRIVVNLDADVDVTTATEMAPRLDSLHQSVEGVLKRLDPTVQRTASGNFALDSGATLASVIVWWTQEPHTSGLPAKQTLERLACAALSAAYPDRAQAMESWLQARPSGPPAGPKEYAWSNMAGWYAEQGCEAFYSQLWSDPAVAQQLQSRLQATGAWRIAQELAQ